MRMSGVTSVSMTKEMVKRFSAMMKSMDLIVVVIIICAAGLAFIVLYNLTNINITERIREIATIKVLGFYSGETALYVFRENILLTILGAFVGLLMGKWLHAFVMHEIKVEMVTFGVRISPISFLYSVIL
ncbi:MAG: FtsX-like permease family protein, partial [Lachnospiraceae bacterium]|nr:FtsX-like permease family protein [Lachnospiraceae bacterium]